LNSKANTLRILTQKEFEFSIGEIMKEKSPITMIDAILHFCEQTNIEIETAAALISNSMKCVIENEAIRQNLLHSKHARLPLID
jgi:Phage late-transcription coactivator